MLDITAIMKREMLKEAGIRELVMGVFLRLPAWSRVNPPGLSSGPRHRLSVIIPTIHPAINPPRCTSGGQSAVSALKSSELHPGFQINGNLFVRHSVVGEWVGLSQ